MSLVLMLAVNHRHHYLHWRVLYDESGREEPWTWRTESRRVEVISGCGQAYRAQRSSRQQHHKPVTSLSGLAPMLPSFLLPLTSVPKHAGVVVQNAIFRHKKPLGQAHCLWWSPKDESRPPETVILFIPGWFFYSFPRFDHDRLRVTLGRQPRTRRVLRPFSICTLGER